jgi:hypothetical protein
MLKKLSILNHQSIILIGILSWVVGVYLDANLFRFGYVFIMLGTVVALFGTGIFLLSKENRSKVKSVFRPKRDFFESFMEAFSWKRISILWGIGGLFAITLLHVSSIIMRSTDAYECAIQGVMQDEKILSQLGDVKGFTYITSGQAKFGYGYSELHFGVMGSKSSVNVRVVVEGFANNCKADGVYVEE